MTTDRGIRLAGLLAGLAVIAVVVTPAGAHVGGTVSHLWNQHLLPLAKQTFFTKTQANARYLEDGSAKTGSVGCPGHAFVPNDSTIEYGTSASLRYMAASGGGSFMCALHLPDGAVMTRLSATLKDNHDFANVTCAIGHTVLATGGETALAEAGTTVPGTPGQVQLEDTTITSPTIDNGAFAYRLACTINGNAAQEVGFYAVAVDYAISPEDGLVS